MSEEQFGSVAAEQGPAAPEGHRPLRILLADDDEINRAIVGHILAGQPGLVLVETCDGRAALERALTQRFDLLIFDLNMPGINGDRLIRYLRASASVNARAPMALFTAWASGDPHEIESRAPGMTRLASTILPKPIRAEAFLAALARLLPGRVVTQSPPAAG